MNLSKLRVTDYSSDNRVGWYIGPKIVFSTMVGLSLDAALEYSQRELNLSTSNGANRTSEDRKLRTIELPVNLRYNLGLGESVGLYLSTGPQFGFALRDAQWVEVGSDGTKKNTNITWNVGLGLRLLEHFEIGLGYNFAVGNTGKVIKKSSSSSAAGGQNYKTDTFQIQFAYMF